VEKIGIIGGSGFYDLGKEEINIKTPFGDVKCKKKLISNEREVIFIARHGKDHGTPPDKVNYRANIYAMHKLNVRAILVTNAVGSFYDELKPGFLVIPHDIIDFTKNRIYTFFNGNFTTTVNGKKKSGVVHTDVTEPFDNIIRKKLFNISKEHYENVVFNGVIAVTEGPRFETPAEINALRRIGATLAGMTSSPEAFLAKELEIPYATLAVVTNYVAGMQKKVSHEEVIEMFDKMMPAVKKILLSTAEKL